MTSTLPTALAVSTAITHYRYLRDLPCDEMSYLLHMHRHDLTAEAIDQMELGTRIVTVDDLVAISAILDVTLGDLLGHVPESPDIPDDAPLGTGLTEDLSPVELMDWLRGRLQLDNASRASWWAEREARLELLPAHLVEQLEGAKEELCDDDSGEESGARRQSDLLRRWISSGELAVHDVSRQLAVIGMRIDQLRSPE